MKTTWLAVAALACACSGAARAGDEAGDPAVVPYRPSVSTPAQLSAPGWLELEAGGLRATGPDSGTSRTTLPCTLKLAFTPDWGIRVGGDAWVRQAAAGAVQQGAGDTSVVLKRRFAASEATAWGLELGETLPTARHDVGVGHAQTTVNGIFSSDFAPGWHTDVNLDGTRQGRSGRQASAWQAGWAAAVSRNLSDAVGAVGEFSGTHQPGAPGQAQFLAAASWNESNAAVFDVGAAHGLNNASPRWQVFAGVTLRLARLF